MKTGMHNAKIRKSERLQRVLKMLADGREHTTWEIQQAAVVCAVGTVVSELRANGIHVECKRVPNAPGGGVRWAYSLGR